MSAITKNLPTIYSFMEVDELRGMRAVSREWKTAIDKRIWPQSGDLDNPVVKNFMDSLYSMFNRIPHPEALDIPPKTAYDFKQAIDVLESRFKDCEDPSQISTAFLAIVSPMVQSVIAVPKKTIVECDMNEAVFTSSLDKMPIAATFGLGPCIAVIGYDDKRKWGFMIHLSDSRALVSPVDGHITMAESGAMLFKEILQRSEGDRVTLRVRGGISGVSDNKLKDIGDWLKLCNEGGAALQLVREDGDALAKNPATVRAVALDTRSGRISDYDPSKNPHSQAHVNWAQSGTMNSGELQNWLEDKMHAMLHAGIAPKIRVVYPNYTETT